MIKIRPITAQINTQKFISNFSSLLAKSWRGERPKLLLGGRWGPQLPLHTPGTCSSLSQCGLSPGPLLPRDSHHHLGGPLCRGVSSPTRGLLHRWGGGPGEAWDGDGNFSALLLFFFCLVGPREFNKERSVASPGLQTLHWRGGKAKG